MAQYDEITRIRLALLAAGYRRPLPNQDKVPPFGFTKAAFLEEQCRADGRRGIPTWVRRYPDRRSTGVGVQDGLVVLDSDVDDAWMSEQLKDKIAGIAPDVYETAPLRLGKGVKFALFARYDGAEPLDGKSKFRSHSYQKPGAGPNDPDYCFEAFLSEPGGACKHQVGCYGPHTTAPNGEVRVWYRFDPEGPELHEVPFAELPLISLAQIMAIGKAFEDLAEAAGWVKVTTDHGVTSGGPLVIKYTIDRDTTAFNLGGGRVTDYAGLSRGDRCTASFHDGINHGNASRCSADYMWSLTDQPLGVKDFDTGYWHLPKDLDPAVHAAELGAIIRGLQDDGQLPPAPEPATPNNYALMVQHLVANYGYCVSTGTVIDIHEPSDQCQYKLEHFVERFASWRGSVITEGNKPKTIYAAKDWSVQLTRVHFDGVRMHPGRPFPSYTENGKTFKNTYRPPQHQGEGEVETWMRFMGHLLPDPVQRAYFLNWLAHKVQNPHIPMVTPIMVAVDANGPVYGCGRGLLGDILTRLFLPAYVRPLDFDVFAGISAQSVYTDWGAYALLVLVNEARDTSESARWSARNAIYERLKEINEPRPTVRTFTSKYGKAFQAMSFASKLIFSNNLDAFQLPADDRRFTVLMNGKRLTSEQAKKLQDWMDQPGNIADLYRNLQARDIAEFDPYLPLETDAKIEMQHLAESELTEALREIRTTLGPLALFTGDQIVQAVQRLAGSEITHNERNYVRRNWLRGAATQVPSVVSNMRIRDAQNRRHKVLCWRNYRGPAVDDVEIARAAIEQSWKALFPDDDDLGTWLQ